MDMDVEVDDLSCLYKEYLSSRTRWKAIGCALGVSAADLEAIEINQRGKCEDCFLQILISWLRKGRRKTEEELRQAIDLCNVGEGASLFPNWRYIIILILLSILSAISAVHVHGWLTSPLTTDATAHSLLDFTANNTMERTGYPGSSSLYRYWNPSVSDHFYTTNIHEIGTAAEGTTGHHGYVSEGTQCLLYTSQVEETVPLYRYWRSAVSDHFYTTSSQEIGTTTPGVTGRHGYVSEGITGYCFPHAVAGTVPLYRYWKGGVSDHFYTTNAAEIGTTTPGQVGRHGYHSEGVVCYVIPY